ncbi:hypothetical protein Syun_021624 [Stephania yunnanensis]|uniref:Uncharacterized protein n=1 Tax=Stephania yunnanensis TaxID=152371 RepID=A0AAP0IHW5_9MAGN
MAFDQLAGGEKVAVLIGGRVAGAFLPKSLQFHANVVFIDPFLPPISSLGSMEVYSQLMAVAVAWLRCWGYSTRKKEYFEIPRASLRAMVEPSFAKRFVAKQIEDHPRRQETDSDVAESELRTMDIRIAGHQNRRQTAESTWSTAGRTMDNRCTYRCRFTHKAIGLMKRACVTT